MLCPNGFFVTLSFEYAFKKLQYASFFPSSCFLFSAAIVLFLDFYSFNQKMTLLTHFILVIDVSVLQDSDRPALNSSSTHKTGI